MTQEELLAEAAQTELENTASVALLMAAEEEVKARAAVRRGAYSGPLLRYRSKQVNGEAVVRPLCSSMKRPRCHLYCCQGKLFLVLHTVPCLTADLVTSRPRTSVDSACGLSGGIAGSTAAGDDAFFA